MPFRKKVTQNVLKNVEKFLSLLNRPFLLLWSILSFLLMFLLTSLLYLFKLIFLNSNNLHLISTGGRQRRMTANKFRCLRMGQQQQQLQPLWKQHSGTAFLFFSLSLNCTFFFWSRRSHWHSLMIVKCKFRGYKHHHHSAVVSFRLDGSEKV